jgi:hypothetical protein
LTNENLDTLRTAAAPLDPRDRGRYLEAVAEGYAGSSQSRRWRISPGLSRYCFSFQACPQRRWRQQRDRRAQLITTG